MGELRMTFWIGKHDDRECTFMEDLDVKKRKLWNLS